MDDNVLDAACSQRASPQAAKRAGLSKGACSSPPCPLGGADVALQEGSSGVPRLHSRDTHRLYNHGKVLKGLNRLRLNRTLCDVVLCCEGQEVPCHRSVLASVSPYFEAMFTSDMVESTQEKVTIRGVTPQMIALLVNYAYTSKVSISTDNVEDLLAASDSLDFKAVGKACDEYMMTRQHHMTKQRRMTRQRHRRRQRHMTRQRHGDTDLGTYSDAVSVPLSPLENLEFVDFGHTANLLRGLDRLRLNRTLCDVVLCCEGQEVPCHRSVLASVSSYFEAMFTSGMVESTQDRVTIRGVEPQIMGLMVDYAYTCGVTITKTITKMGVITSNVQALLAASDLFDVTDVRDYCCEVMERGVDKNNCVEIYCLAKTHSCEKLKKRSMDYILEVFSAIYQQEEFLSLSVERLAEILSSDHLNVPNEDMVFDAAMLWLDRCPTRKQNFGKVLEHVRLPLISPSYLHTVVERLDVVKEHQGCQRFISEAKERPYCNPARPRRTTVIVMVGQRAHWTGQNELDSYDPRGNHWKTMGGLPMRITSPVVVALGSTLYLAGEYYDGYIDLCNDCDSEEEFPDCYVEEYRPWTMWRYDPHNVWLKMANTKLERSHNSLVVLDGYLFAVGGWGQGSEETRDSMERYDPNTDTWQLMDSVGVAAHYNNDSCVVALDGHLYCIGGAPDKRITNPPQMAKYNPNTSVWTQLAPMQIPRSLSAVCRLNGKIYVTGGLWTDEDNEVHENRMECYDPKTNQWTMCAPMQAKRYAHSVAVVDGKIYVLGGEGESGYRHVIECYSEETDTWEPVGEMPYARIDLRCVSLKLRNDHGQHMIIDNDPEDYYSDY